MVKFVASAALAAAWILLYGLIAAPIYAQDVSAGPVTSVAEARQAVVQIKSVGAFVPFAEADTVLEESTGTGFIIDPEGFVVTNAHVVNGGEAFYVYLDGEALPQYATVLGISECSDLAVLDMRGSGYPYLEWADKSPSVGERVYAVGYPGGRYKMSRGMVEDAFLATDTPWASVENVIYHSAAIAPGNSGGPLLNSAGQVLGVNFANKPYEGSSVAISWEEAQAVVGTLANGLDLDSIGINGEAFLSEDEDIFGIWVVSVDSDSPAAAIGVEPADILLSLEKIPLGMGGNLGTYCTVLRSHTSGEILHLTLARLSTKELMCGQINGEPLFNCDELLDTTDNRDATEGALTGNGIYWPKAESTISGAVPVQAVALHPDFWKWQVDLLVEGSKETYIGSGGLPISSPTNIVVLNTSAYPNGRHVLRLRVVRKDGNYDEYLTPINIDN